MDKILSLAERYAPTHSLGSDLIDTNSGLKLPYILIIPHTLFTSNSGIPAYSFTPTNTTIFSSQTNAMHDKILPSSDLVYPFNNPDNQDSLPVLGPIVTLSLLPMDTPREPVTGYLNARTDESLELS